MSFKLSGKNKFLCFLTGAAIIYLLRDTIIGSVFYMLFHDLGITGIAALDICLTAIGFSAVISLVDAVLKAAVYKIIDCDTVIGFKGIYAYTRNLSEVPLHRIKFLAVQIIPAAIISIAALPLPVWAGGLVQTLNLLRNRKEIVMAVYIFTLSRKYFILEKPYGFDAVQHNPVKKEERMAA